MISFLKNPPSPPFPKGGYRMQILSVFSRLILNSFMNVCLILRGQTFSSLTGQTSGLPIIELHLHTAILGENIRRLLQDKALRNDTLRKLYSSLRAERSNLKGFQIHRESLWVNI